MNKPLSIVGKARLLVESHGKEYAINFYKNKIEELGAPKNFEDVCTLAGYETAIEWLELGDEGLEAKVVEFLASLKK